MRVLIAGAGPAGLTLAYWLTHYGMTPTIVERAPQLPTGGYKIDVRGIALDVLRHMMLYDDVLAASTDMQGGLLVDKRGKILQKMSGDAFGHRQGDDLEIIRGELCKILLNKLPSNTEILFNDSISAIQQQSSTALVQFTHADTREFDLVVGADGLHSTVRQLAFGDENQFIHDLGMYLCVFNIPNYLNLDRVEVQYTEFSRIALVWCAKGEMDAKACFAFKSPIDIDRRNRVQQQQVINAVFQDVGWEVPKLLQLMPEAHDYYFDSAAQIFMNSLSNDRVVLLGDAGYCASPMSGQGTSLALVGAYILAGELAAANGNYKKAFDYYETGMRPFILANQAVGQAAAKRLTSVGENTWRARCMTLLLRLIPGFLIRRMIDRSTQRIQHAATAIKLKDYAALIKDG